LRRLIRELGYDEEEPTPTFSNNVSAIKLSKNYVLHRRSKHIDVRFHFLRDLCKDGVIDVIYCKREEQIAYIMTKPLKTAVFEKLRSMLRVCSRKEVIHDG